MKKFLLGFLVLIVALFGIYFYMTQPLVKTANGFFNAIKEDNLTKVETYLSEGFKANTTSKQLAEYLVNYKIVNYKAVKFGLLARRIKVDFNDMNSTGNEGTISGTITTNDGITSPLKLVFQKEKNEWKIFFIEKELSKNEKEESARKQKLISEYTQLARVSIHQLGAAIKDKNMTILHDSISEMWKKQATVKDLDKIYGVFYKKGVNLIVLDKVVPALTTANVDKQGVLTLVGFYQVTGNKVHFTQKYIPENKIWKLVGLSVNIK